MMNCGYLSLSYDSRILPFRLLRMYGFLVPLLSGTCTGRCRDPMKTLILTSSAISDSPLEVFPNQLPLVMGRSQDADLTISDKLLSRKHSEICVNEAGDFLLCDLDSTNLTIVNEKDVSRHVLQDGDRILLGDTEIQVEIRPAPAGFNEQTTSEFNALPNEND